MAGYLVVAVLAAFGVLSLLWALFGWLLPVCREGWILCPGKPGELSAVYVFLWLRSVGLVKCPLVLVDLGLSREERACLTEKGIEIWGLAELSERLGIGAETS